MMDGNENLWMEFSSTVSRLVDNFDVLQRAVSEGWGEYDPEICRQRFIKDLLENCQEKWQSGKDISMDQVNLFFVETFESFFYSDIGETAIPISKVIAELFNNCRNGNRTGLAEVNQLIQQHQGKINRNENLDSSDMDVEMEDNEPQHSKSPKYIEQDDGWTTVAR